MLSFRITVKKWGEGQGIITGYEGLKIAKDLIPGIIYSSKTSRLCTGCVNIVPSALPRLIQSPMLSLAVLLPRLKTEVGTIGRTVATHAGGSDLLCRGSLMRGSGVWITASNLSLLLCPKNEGWSGYRVRRHNMGVIQAPELCRRKSTRSDNRPLALPSLRGDKHERWVLLFSFNEGQFEDCGSLPASVAPSGRWEAEWRSASGSGQSQEAWPYIAGPCAVHHTRHCLVLWRVTWNVSQIRPDWSILPGHTAQRVSVHSHYHK